VFSNTNPTINLYKPVPVTLNPILINQSNYIAVAGSDIQIGSQVYLLYEIPTAFLARNFNNSSTLDDKVKIYVSILFLVIFNKIKSLHSVFLKF
jgi:hypothetical protein